MIKHDIARPFDNHPVTLKEQLETTDEPAHIDSADIDKEKLLQEKTVLVLQPRLIQFADIDWSTLDGDEDLISISKADGKTLTVIYSTMTLLD